MIAFDEVTKNVLGISVSECTGCMACKTICGKNAIGVVEDKERYFYPQVDITKCVQCGNCKKICPVNNSEKKGRECEDRKCYVGNVKNVEVLRNSASGGVFAELARYILVNNGYVAGAVYENNYKSVHHIVSRSIEDIQKMQGSKYCKSRSYEVYQEVLELVKSGKKVLFSGVGCECAAIKRICGKYLDKLLLVQIVCKGALSEQVLSKHISILEKKSEEIVDYTMRYKDKGALPAYEYVYRRNGKKEIKPYYETLHGRLYASNALLRNSCYKCKFRGEGLVGDIVIGDAPYTSQLEKSALGCSTIIVNSSKGAELINRININLREKKEWEIYRHCQKLIFNPYRSLGINRKRIFDKLMKPDANGNEIEDYLRRRKYILIFQRKLWKFFDLVKYNWLWRTK